MSVPEDVAHRAVAALLGVALGDALGAPAEFMPAGEIKTKYWLLR